MGIHFLIAQIIAGIGVWVIRRQGGNMDTYLERAVLLTGITALAVMPPALYFYRADHVRRIAGGLVSLKKESRLTWKEFLFLLLTGAGLAQYGNLIAGLLQVVFNITDYQETMTKLTDGKSVWMLIFWMGIIAPVAEEFIFRWLIYLRLRDYMRIGAAAIISGLIFGIYHGNLVQAVYASILGAVFAYVMEMSGSLWSCVLLHIGANIWAVLMSEYGTRMISGKNGVQIIIILDILLLAGLVSGIIYFVNKGCKRKGRCI